MCLCLSSKCLSSSNLHVLAITVNMGENQDWSGYYHFIGVQLLAKTAFLVLLVSICFLVIIVEGFRRCDCLGSKKNKVMRVANRSPPAHSRRTRRRDCSRRHSRKGRAGRFARFFKRRVVAEPNVVEVVEHPVYAENNPE